VTLAVAVVVAAPGRVPAWLARLVATLPDARVVGMITAGPTPARASGLLRAYETVDTWLRPASPEHAAAAALDLPRLDAAGSLPALDLVLDPLGLADGRLARAARHGLWSWRAGRGDALLTEFVADDEVADVVLEIRPPDGPPRALLQATALVDPTSLGRSRVVFGVRVEALVGRTVAALAAGRPLPGTPAPLPPSDGAPSSLRLAARVARLAPELVRRQFLKRAMDEEWFLALRPLGARPLWEDATGLRTLQPPADCAWADPFPFRDQLFFEACPYRSRKGAIAVTPLDGSATARVVLERDHHLAYPQVFDAEGAIWMLPDNGGSGAIELYRATEFPWRWEPALILPIAERLVDPTLLVDDATLWLFAGRHATAGGASDELLLFSAPRLAGPWTAHPENPIVSDARRARCAGRPFRRDGRLYRPAQDCARGYGRAIVFNEVLELGPARYRERPAARLDPTWTPGLNGTHTYNATDGVEVIDGRRHRLRACR
jgi:hypothetical protein